MKPDAFIAMARTWLGVPFRHQGRTRHGVDCIGVVICLAQESKFVPDPLDEPIDYTRQPQKELLRKGVARWCDRILAPEPACVVLMRWPKMTYEAHAGILLHDNHLLHAYQQVNKVIEITYGAPWSRMHPSYWRFRGMEA